MIRLSNKIKMLMCLLTLNMSACGSKSVFLGLGGQKKSAPEKAPVDSGSDDALGDNNGSSDEPLGQESSTDAKTEQGSSEESGQQEVPNPAAEETGKNDSNETSMQVNEESQTGDPAMLIGTPECATEEVTRSVLKTETLSRELTKKEVQYEIYAVDCLGKIQEPAYIHFSFDYETSPVDTISYQLRNPETNEVITSGKLEKFLGEDISGNKQGDSFYFRTDKEINLGSGPRWVFSVDVSDVNFIKPKGMNAYDQLPVWFKIGSYKETQKNIKLLEEGCLLPDESRVDVLTEKLELSLNTKVNVSMEFELYSKDCLGNPVVANEILFDLNYRFKLDENIVSPVSYTIHDEVMGIEVGSGSLQLIKGEDLFGNKGSTFFYHRTDESFSFPEVWDKVKFIISWTDMELIGPLNEGSDPAILPSFIQFGQNLVPAKKDIALVFPPQM